MIWRAKENWWGKRKDPIVRYSDRRRRSVEGDRAFKLVEVSRLRSSSNTLPQLGYAVVNCSTPRPSTRIPRAYISIYPFYPFAVTSSGSRYTCLPFNRIRKTEPTEYFEYIFVVSREPRVNKPSRRSNLPSTLPSSFRFSIFTFENKFSRTHDDGGGGGGSDIVVKTITTSQSVVLIV